MSALAQDRPIAAPPIEHHIREMPVLVIMPHNRCHCRCLMCDIWKIRQVREIAAADLEPHIASLRKLKVRWVVFSGGEPLLHSHLPALARVFRAEGIRTTLLTAGLALERHAAQLAEHIDDVIVSLDGPPEIHDLIRGVPGAYRRLEQGIQALWLCRPGVPVSARCTVQKSNVGHLGGAVRSALELQLHSISFLAADISSPAFNHPLAPENNHTVTLDKDDLDRLSAELCGLFLEYPQCFASGFIRESPEKLRRLERHFRALLGLATPVAPRCNAPWVSAVVEADGSVRPCFFHPPFGNIRDATLIEVVNGAAALRFRRQLDIARNSICQRCVCSLFVPAPAAKGSTAMAHAQSPFAASGGF